MVTSGLLLSVEPGQLAAIAVCLGQDSRLSVGAPVEEKLPVVAVTDDALEGEAVAESLRDVAGVRMVDVICVYFEEGGDR